MAILAKMLGVGALAAEAVAALKGLEGATEELESIDVPVLSTAISSISYRGDDTITVVFKRGGTYTYDGDKALFLMFAAAPSKGQFFNEHFQVKR